MFGPTGADPAQLEQMWKMLDDLAENNPTEYEKLIGEAKNDMKKQQKEQEFIPDPGFVAQGILECIDTVITGTSTGPYFAEAFINFCQSSSVLRPFNKERQLAETEAELDGCSVPISLGKSREDMKGVQGKRLIYDVVVHPIVYKRARTDQGFKIFISMLAFEKVVKTGNLRVRKGTLQFPKISYKAGKPQPHVLQFEANPEYFKFPAKPVEQEIELIKQVAPTPGLITVVSEEDFDLEISRVGGRDWVDTVTASNAGDTLNFQVNLISDAEEFEIEGKGCSMTVISGGFEPLEISWENFQVSFETATAQLRPKKKLLTISIQRRLS